MIANALLPHYPHSVDHHHTPHDLHNPRPHLTTSTNIVAAATAAAGFFQPFAYALNS